MLERKLVVFLRLGEPLTETPFLEVINMVALPAEEDLKKEVNYK